MSGFSPFNQNFDLISIVGVQVKRIQGILVLSLIFFDVSVSLNLPTTERARTQQQQQQSLQRPINCKKKKQVKSKEGLYIDILEPCQVN